MCVLFGFVWVFLAVFEGFVFFDFCLFFCLFLSLVWRDKVGALCMKCEVSNKRIPFIVPTKKNSLLTYLSTVNL